MISAAKETNYGDMLISESLSHFLLKNFNCNVINHNFRLQYFDINKNKKNITSLFRYKTVLKKYKNIYITLQVVFFILKLYSYYKLFYNKLKTSDIVIFGGGQLIMDSPKSVLSSLNIIFYSLMCKIFKKKLLILGVGVSSKFNFRITAFSTRLLFDTAQGINLRDVFSFHRALCFCSDTTKISFSNDLVFLDSDIKRYQSKFDAKDSLGISTLPYFHGNYYPIENTRLFTEYLDSLISLRELWKQHGSVYLIPTAYPDFDIARMISNEDTLIPNDIHDLIRNINSTEFFLATRLHSFIISFLLRKRTMCFLWDDKVRGILTSLYGFDYKNYIFQFSDLKNTEKLCSKMLKLKRSKSLDNDYFIFSLTSWIKSNVHI